MWLLCLRAYAFWYRLEEQVKEHNDARKKGDAWKSAIVEHQWDQQLQVDWDGTRLVGRATLSIQLEVKKALHIERTPANARLNHDKGYLAMSYWATGSPP